MSPLNVLQFTCLMLYVYAFDFMLLYGVLVLPPDSINLPCRALFVFATIVFIVCIMQSNPYFVRRLLHFTLE